MLGPEAWHSFGHFQLRSFPTEFVSPHPTHPTPPRQVNEWASSCSWESSFMGRFLLMAPAPGPGPWGCAPVQVWARPRRAAPGPGAWGRSHKQELAHEGACHEQELANSLTCRGGVGMGGRVGGRVGGGRMISDSVANNHFLKMLFQTIRQLSWK